jgi:hypothetical protein
MAVQKKTGGFLRLAALLWGVAVILFSCDSNPFYAGKYVTHKEHQPAAIEQTIELQEKGQGVWRKEDEEVTFTWNVKRHELRLHLKLGGVIKGQINGDAIELILPGQKVMVFRKCSPRDQIKDTNR